MEGIANFRLIEQKQNEYGALDLTLSFTVMSESISRLDVLFCSDITDQKRMIPMDAAIEQSCSEGAVQATVIIKDFTFSKDEDLDALANISAIVIVAEDLAGNHCELSVPVFCAIENDILRVEVLYC